MPSTSNTPLVVQLAKFNLNILEHSAVDKLKEHANLLRSSNKSLDSLVDGLYRLPTEMPTFPIELLAQKEIDYVWSQISDAGEVKLYQYRIKKLKKERIEGLPARQWKTIGDVVSVLSNMHKGFPKSISICNLAGQREAMLMRNGNNASSDTIASSIWALALTKQHLYISVDTILEYYDNAISLNDFLSQVPHFRAGFVASNAGTGLFQYIKQNIDPVLDIIKIGMSINDNIDWYDVSMYTPLNVFLKRYEAEKGISSMKSVILTHRGTPLFSSNRRFILCDLGMEDGDVISVSPRPSDFPGKRVPLKQVEKNGKPKARSSKATKWEKEKSVRQKKSSHSRLEHAERKKIHFGLWMDAISRVHDEARQLFLRIRQGLDSVNLKRTPRKEKKKKPAQLSQSTTPNLSDHFYNMSIAEKVGKPYIDILVGEPENLYKTAKPSGARMTNQPPRFTIDLHGLTGAHALERLNESLPRWIDAAMEQAYPFVAQVKVVCGGGNQVLSETVKDWIRRNKNVANAPKSNFS